jgi:hypothetical protein
MSQQSVAAASTGLFARKGSAGPCGKSSPEDAQCRPGLADSGGKNHIADRPDDEKAKAKRSGPAEAAPGSLHTIDFRRPRVLSEPSGRPGETVELESDAWTPAADSAQGSGLAMAAAQPPRPVLSHGALLAMLAVVGFGAGLWHALYYEGAGDRPASPAAQIRDPAAASKQAGPNDASERLPVEQNDAAAKPAPPSANSGSAGTAGPAEGTAPQPSFDLIRIEPNGEAVIAGRAAPDTELILLDNGQPIGKVTADWAGEWAFIPDAPLAPGDHEFSLVIVTPHGTVAVPAVGRPDKGASLVPPGVNGRPEAGTTAENAASSVQSLSAVLAALKGVPKTERSYVVQLSSTTSRHGAEQEWLKLKRNFPGLLGDKELNVHQAVLERGDTRYRVRTGSFAEKAPARALCSEFRAKRQDCLVIER